MSKQRTSRSPLRLFVALCTFVLFFIPAFGPLLSTLVAVPIVILDNIEDRIPVIIRVNAVIAEPISYKLTRVCAAQKCAAQGCAAQGCAVVRLADDVRGHAGWALAGRPHGRRSG